MRKFFGPSIQSDPMTVFPVYMIVGPLKSTTDRITSEFFPGLSTFVKKRRDLGWTGEEDDG